MLSADHATVYYGRRETHMKNYLRDYIPGAALSFAGCFMLALYAPLELLFNNTREFRFGFRILFPQLLKLFGIGLPLCLAVFALCYVLCRRLYDIVLCVGIAAYLGAYVQGMFLSGHLPPLDGTTIQWDQYTGQNILSITVWLAIFLGIGLAAFFLRRKGIYRIVTAVSAFLTAVLLVTVIASGIINHGFSDPAKYALTKNNEFTMSSDQNLVVFVVDATDSRTFSEMLAAEDPQFADVLEDFTYYPDTVGAYPFTKLAIPYILHGQWYENQEDFFKFTDRAVSESPLLTALREKGYQSGIYEEDLYWIGSESLKDLDNIEPFRYQLSSSTQLIKEELKLVWFKYAPWPLKRCVLVDKDRFNHLLLLPDGLVPFNDDNSDFYQTLQSSDVTVIPEKCFRFIHIEGAHVPFRYDKDVNLIENGTYEQNIECSMTVVAAYLQKLRDAGVYDNSAIVLMADHGYGHKRARALIGRLNPLLAVKGVGEKHPMGISEAPISYEDLQEMYRRLLNGAPGTEVFDAREGDTRTRRTIMYDFKEEDQMAEFVQTGHAFDIETMIPTGRIYCREKDQLP